MTNLDAEAGVYYDSGSDSPSRTKFNEDWSVYSANFNDLNCLVQQNLHTLL